MLLRLGVGVPEDVRHSGHDLQIARLPPVPGEPPLDVGVELPAGLHRGVPGEDHVGGRGGELPALGGVPGLDDDRMPLRGARDGELALDPELRPAVGEAMPLPVRGPGVPQLPGGGEELGGPRVPVGPVQIAAAPEVLAGEGVRGGDDVPGGPARAEMVERGEPPGQFVRLVEGGVDRTGQAEPVGDGGERVQDGDRLGLARRRRGRGCARCARAAAAPRPGRRSRRARAPRFWRDARRRRSRSATRSADRPRRWWS